MTHPFLSYSGYGLVPALPNPFSFLGFSSCLLVSNFFFRFVVVHSSQIRLVWLYDHHLRGVFSLLPIGRHLCSFARIIGYKPRCFGLQRRQTSPRHPPRALPRFRYFPHAIPGVWSSSTAPSSWGRSPERTHLDLLDQFASSWGPGGS